MDNYQKVEQLVSKTGCSYEDAKAALEACSWDMLDAVISLEKDGKIIKESAEKKVEAAEDAIPEITPEVIAADEGQKNYSRYDEASAGSSNGRAKGNGKAKTGIFQRIRNMLMNNRMVILNNNGKALKDLPILVPIIALIFFFWATLGLAVLAMLFGFRFHFEGEHLGKTNINSTMDKATDYAEKVKDDLMKKARDE